MPRNKSEARKISQLTYVIPFGRYVGTKEVRERADEVLVGREGHRAYFVDLLIGTGRKGAFLVTGRRGAGKTSFVSHCIAEYEASVLRRFLRHDIGHAFWDRVLVLLFWALLLIGALLLSEVLYLLVPLTGRGPHLSLLWLLAVPIAVALLFPCVYSRAVFEVLRGGLAKGGGITQDRPSGSVIATLMALLAAGVLWFLPGLSSPAWSASAVLTCLAAQYFGGQAVAVRRVRRPGEGGAIEVTFRMWAVKWGWDQARVERWVTKTRAWVHGGWIRLAALVVVSVITLLTWRTLAVSAAHLAQMPEDATPDERRMFLLGAVAIHFGVSLFMLGGGLLLRALYQLWGADRSVDCIEPKDRLDVVHDAIRRGAKYYLGPAIALLGSVFFFGWPTFDRERSVPAGLGDLAWLAVVVSGLVVVFCLCRLLDHRRNSGRTGPAYRFRPPSRGCLWASALVSILLALQLAQPLLTRVLDPVVGRFAIASAARQTPPWNLPPSLAAIEPLQLVISRPLFRTVNGAELAAVPAPRERVWLAGGFVFGSRFEALLWLALVVGVMACLHFVQYEWIVRPHLAAREGDPPDIEERAPWEDGEIFEGPSQESRRWRWHRKMAELTLPWTVARIWLPSVAVSVNLGLDAKLGSGPVIQAMLVGLRNAYHRLFTSWTAGPANIGRLGALIGLLVLVTLAGDAWFKVPSARTIEEWSATAVRREPDGELDAGSSACSILNATREMRPVILPDLVCGLGDYWFRMVYFDFAPNQLKAVSREPLPHPVLEDVPAGRSLLLNTLLPFRDPYAGTCPRDVLPDLGTPSGAACRWSELFPAGLHFDVYHLVLFMAFLVVARSTFKRLPVLPFQQNLKRIDDLLDSMTARTRFTERPSLWEPARWVYSLVADRVRETEREPLDPRTVELAFLQILEDIQRGGVRMPGIARRHLNLPTPEVTFVFDELDKLGTRFDPEEESSSSVGAELRALQADQERALRLRSLLSDLKNILASAPARFVFIGGRNLHDEWLADQTARQPLLTNIFIAEVYLPSLLTDHAFSSGWGRKGPYRLHYRIEEYVVRQYRRAQELYEESVLKLFRPKWGLASTGLAQERFAAGEDINGLTEELRLVGRSRTYAVAQDRRTVETIDLRQQDSLLRDLVAFLALRSMGNPKQLKELLASFIRPVTKEVLPEGRWQLPCHQVLRLRDDDIFRIQLIASIYRQLAAAFESRMVKRDDKMATSVFFLSDFLIKFHRRAFSWANLERVDELAHIHRAPDLREIQEEMVEMASERMLHRVLNGMYSFRFRSDVAREVEYLSRRSAAEMAALNFTLDESQSLKAIYRAALEQREQRDGPNPGLVAALGELYEFDQEYETARYHYRRAIEIHDERLSSKVGSKDAVREVLRGNREGLEDARVFLPWGEARLRLMLQIGMTFEISRSLEHAVTEYRAARTLARALVKAFLGHLDRRDEEPTWPRSRKEDIHTGRLHTLKNLSILFQPLFAEAWASEKITGTVDTSGNLLEAGLWEVRTSLPWVRTAKLSLVVNPTEPPHANLGLTLAQLHNKAGDLYFFKGRQPVDWDKLLTERFLRARGDDRDTDGYLLRAHYHYAVSLHDLRRFVCQRIQTSQMRLGLTGGRTLTADAFPDLLYQAVARSVNDMAEATLGRTSLFGLLRTLADQGSPDLELAEMPRQLRHWLQLRDRQTSDDTEQILANWLGRWYRTDFDDSAVPLIDFAEADTAAARLLVAVHLCRAGAVFFRDGGYVEDAARELLQVCSIVNRVLWWFRTFEVLVEWADTCDPDSPAFAAVAIEVKALQAAVFSRQTCIQQTQPFMEDLLELGVDLLEQAKDLFLRSRGRPPSSVEGLAPGLQADDRVPTECLTLACSYGLWCESIGGPAKTIDRLKAFADACHKGVEGPNFAERILTSLESQRFPLLNRLNGLQILIDDFVLNAAREDDPAASQTRLMELLELNEQYAAPLHFTPHQSGTTCAMFWLRAKRLENSGAPVYDEALKERALRTGMRDLRASEETCTLRRAFYRAIADLYYLYDDFNDRQIHYKHALQMAGAELTTVLKHLLEIGDR